MVELSGMPQSRALPRLGEDAGAEAALARFQTAMRVPVGGLSPLWMMFAGAASAGVAYWWMTRWTRPVNLEALLPEPPAETPVEVEAVEAVAETVAETAEAVQAAVEEIAQEISEPIVEAIVEAAPADLAPPPEPAPLEVAPPEASAAPAAPRKKAAPRPKAASPKSE